MKRRRFSEEQVVQILQELEGVKSVVPLGTSLE